MFDSALTTNRPQEGIMSKYSVTISGDTLAALAAAALAFAAEAGSGAPEVAQADPPKPAAPRQRKAAGETTAAPASAAPAAAGVQKPALMKVLTALCNLPNGRKRCGDLLEKHGAADRKIGSLPEASFAAAFAEATKIVEDGAQESPLG